MKIIKLIRNALHINKTPIDISKDEKEVEFHFGETYDDLVNLLSDNLNYMENHSKELKLLIADLSHGEKILKGLYILNDGNSSNDEKRKNSEFIIEKLKIIETSSKIMLDNNERQMRKLKPGKDKILNEIYLLLKEERTIFAQIYNRCKIFKEEYNKGFSRNIEALINTIFIVVKQAKVLELYLNKFESKEKQIIAEIKEVISMFDKIKEAI